MIKISITGVTQPQQNRAASYAASSTGEDVPEALDAVLSIFEALNFKKEDVEKYINLEALRKEFDRRETELQEAIKEAESKEAHKPQSTEPNDD